MAVAIQFVLARLAVSLHLCESAGRRRPVIMWTRQRLRYVGCACGKQVWQSRDLNALEQHLLSLEGLH